MPSAYLTEERLLLTKHEAEALIESLERIVKRVVRVCVDDAILYLGPFDRPWTAWLNRDSGKLSVQFEEGWPASFNQSARVSEPKQVKSPPAAAVPDPPTSTTTS